MLVELGRSFLIFLHLVFFAGAFSLVLWGDFSILHSGVEKIKIRRICNAVIALLLMLWATGLAIIYMDTQFVFMAIAQKPKLVMKLVCVSVLSANGVFLHYYCFKELIKEEYLSRKKATNLCVGGALSTSSWVLAAYIGSATMLNQLPLSRLLVAYFMVIGFAVLIGIFLSPFLRSIINAHRTLGQSNRRDIKTHLKATNRGVLGQPKYSPVINKRA